MPDKENKFINKISLNFIPTEYNPTKDPYFYRNKKNEINDYRKLSANEIEILIKNNNISEDWNEISVTNQFDPTLIKNCEFFGRITLGKLTPIYLEYNDLKLPVGLSNSTIISSDIGDNVVIRDVHYLSHYKIGNNCILFNIDEMVTTNHAKFGNGIIKEGEKESVRIWLEICNENEGRKVLAFESMIPADAYIWSKFRDDDKLMEKFTELTNKDFDNKRGYYGVVGNNSVVKNSSIIKDVKIGEYAYIKGANKLKNLTILSSKEESSQIGEGVELVNGIMGYGSKIFYGCKAIRFITGRNTQLKYGARLLNSILGDNSTVSCCEILNNLIFPFHEQHHNNSFLIASTVMGQSNIAAGATIGSNHNSRTPDGEIIANRGFWPGLCTNFKHNCKFASFILIAKGSYCYEMNIQYPFSLVSIDQKDSSVTIMPAYWFIYNMYAIARNNFKFKQRDKRKIKIQNVEFDHLAPDTISEVLLSIQRIKYLLGITLLNDSKTTEEDAVKKANEYLKKSNPEEIILFDEKAVKKTGAKIIKPMQALTVYEEICKYFVIKNILYFFNAKQKENFKEIQDQIITLYQKKNSINWWNIGGQIVSEEDLEELKKDIKNDTLKTWEEIHTRYNNLWNIYPEQKTRFALYTLEKINNKKISNFTSNDWKELLKEGILIFEKILKLSISTREKDYTDKFRKMVYSNDKEMEAVLGNIKDNSFLKELDKTTKEDVSIIHKLIKTI